MYEFTLTFAVLLGFHFLCDYPLQGDFVAKFKARKIDGKHNIFWKHCLTSHSYIHALPLLLLTGSLLASAFLFVTHWIIDFLKCENKISLNQDQALHLIVIAHISVYLYFQNITLSIF